MKDILNPTMSPNDVCWETGRYSSDCDCSMCDHSYECSGSSVNDGDEED